MGADRTGPCDQAILLGAQIASEPVALPAESEPRRVRATIELPSEKSCGTVNPAGEGTLQHAG
jgi:hypothetical protein